MNDSKSDHNTLWDSIGDIRFGMLTHRHNDGMLYSHPLTTQNKSLDQEPVLHFFIFEKSELANDLRQDGNVNVSYASPDDDRYISIVGIARWRTTLPRLSSFGRLPPRTGFLTARLIRISHYLQSRFVTPSTGTLKKPG